MKKALTIAISDKDECTLVASISTPVPEQIAALRAAKPKPGLKRLELWIQGQRGKYRDFAQEKADADRVKEIESAKKAQEPAKAK